MLSPRQTEVFDFIQEEHARSGIMPSSREIQERFGYASQTSVVDILTALEKKGVLKREPGKARALKLLGSSFKELLKIPIFGTIPAGLPANETQEEDGCLSVDLESIQLPRGARVFALKVRGDSMIGAGILPKDTVVFEFRDPKHGDIVAALIDGDVTLKRYLLRKGKPYLKAENSNYPDLIPAHELVIQGVQVALFRVTK